MRGATFTTKEDAIIIKMIEQHPTNINFAIEQAADKIGRTHKSVTARYYNKLKNKEKILAIGTPHGIAEINVKNTRMDKDLSNEDKFEILSNMILKLKKPYKIRLINLLFS